MNSRSKLAGALVAVALLCGVMAAVAQAQGPAVLTTENGEAVTGVAEQGETSVIFTRGTRSFACEKVQVHGVAKNHDSTFDVAPSYEKCSTNLGGPMTVTNTGCFYRFHLGASATEAEDTWTASASLHCEKDAHMVVHAYLNASQHAEKPTEPTCQYTYTDNETTTNQELGTIDLTNEPASEETPKDWVQAHINIGGIHSTRIRGSALLCGPVTHESGEMHGTCELKAASEGGAPIGVTISTTQ